MFCHLCLAERDSLLEGRCPSVMALKFYLCYECLESHLEILDEKDDAETMVSEVIGNVKMSHAATRIFPMMNVGSGHKNGTTENGKSYLIQFCRI